ncbi:kelch domain-containing protein 1 isoform X3 [Boleophthalmus pectinirostris]|nr:kelch domain-containing protein 1 isoform X3 [Boleophthalmus pectinirostris]XP_055017533.1 kelch domain-containing protein 1 isoform X3 [Boleophthalmus pectinirostris]
MSGSCGCCLNGVLFIFGGCDDNGQTNEISNQKAEERKRDSHLFSLDLTDGIFTWKKIVHESGAPPSPRDKLSCWVYDEKIIYFGGYGHKVLSDLDSHNRNFIVDETSWAGEVFWGWNNEVHVFDPKNLSWSQPQTFGRAPAPRAAHASATIGSRGYICGGRVMETRTNDIHCLDLQTYTWTELVPSSCAPVGRSWHSLSPVSDSSLFLFGGLSMDCNPMSDGWVFDTETRKWTEVEHPFKNKPRLWHTACPGRDSDVIVFGGSCDYILLVDTGHCNDALVFQTQPYPLSRICEDYIARTVQGCDSLRTQVPLLPTKLQSAVHTRMCFYRPSKKQR